VAAPLAPFLTPLRGKIQELIMSTLLTQAARATHNEVLKRVEGTTRYSQFPVHESEFWDQVFKFAKDPKKAQKMLEDLQIIEDEPCIENQRIFANVQRAKSIARIALLN
jgi:hypothetical protein